MKDETKRLLPSLLPILGIILLLPACTIAPTAKTTSGWSYELAAGQEKSQREYLLVRAAGTDHEERFTVTSQCSKPHPAEATYGKCTHTVTAMPSRKTFTLTTGDDVVQVAFTWDGPTLLATIEYGCCAGPDVARFYTEQGEYLGRVEGDKMSDRANYGNVIARTFNMRNGTRFGQRIYLLTLPENPTDTYHTLVFDGKRKPTAIPIAVEIARRDRCEEWYVDKFIAYGDRKDITLELQGGFCKESVGTDRLVFSCLPSEVSVKCEARE